MYNFAKLSEASQRFVGSLKACNTVNAAVAKAIANTLPMPSFPVDNPEAQFKDTCNQTASNLVSNVSEVAVINFAETLEYVRQLWLARYFALNPKEYLYAKDGDSMACFMGFSQVMSPELCDTICKGGADLVTQVNGFGQVIREFITTPELKSDGAIAQAEEKFVPLTPRIR